ncbi:MAG: histidinol-phosphate transaminase [Bacillota bacterium]
MIRLDLNESPLDIPRETKEAILEVLRMVPFNRYRSEYREECIALLARQNQVARDMVVLGNGADEIIALAIAACAGPRGRVVLPMPTFSGYAAQARAAGVGMSRVPAGSDFAFDVGKLARALEQGPAGATLLFLCRPNNPTGYTCALEDVRRLLDTRPDAVVAVDEAYFEFSGLTARDLLEEHPNLVIIRTLSKAFCLAGIRVGYALAWPGLVSRLEGARAPFSISVASYAIAAQVLKSTAEFRAMVRQISEWRDRLYARLLDVPGIRPLPSPANFLLLEVGPGARRLQQELKTRGILVRHYGEESLENYLRVSVGTPSDNDLFVQALEELLNGRDVHDIAHHRAPD